jgi:hypothetical protein
MVGQFAINDGNKGRQAHRGLAGVDVRRFYEIGQGLQNLPVYLTIDLSVSLDRLFEL